MTAEDILEAYLRAAANGVTCSKLKPNEFSVTTSFMYSDADLIKVWVRESNPNLFIVCDKGETFRSESDVCDVSLRAIESAKVFASSMGVEIKNGILSKAGEKKEVGQLIFDVAYTCQVVSVISNCYNNL